MSSKIIPQAQEQFDRYPEGEIGKESGKPAGAGEASRELGRQMARPQSVPEESGMAVTAERIGEINLGAPPESAEKASSVANLLTAEQPANSGKAVEAGVGLSGRRFRDPRVAGAIEEALRNALKSPETK